MRRKYTRCRRTTSQYINSGSHDAGLDTNWRKDPVTGKVTYFGSSKVTITPELADAYRKEKEAKAAT